MSTSKTLTAALSHLYAFVDSFASAQSAQGAASRELVLAAISGRDSFKEATETLYDRIRGNVDSLASKVNAQPAKEAGRFVIPGSLMAQVSQVQRALNLGVKLGTMAKPRGIGEIRKDTAKAAKEAAEAKEAREAKEAAAKMTPEQRKDAELRRKLSDMLAELSNRIASSDIGGKSLAELYALTVDFYKDASAIAPESEEATTTDSGEAMARAA